jgi:GNAT superfamily N-acetyltransferase
MAIAAVRAAARSDVDEITRIQADTWAAAYAALVPAEAIEQLRGPEARAAWAAAVDGGHVLVATEGEWTVGFVLAAVATGATAAAPDDIEPGRSGQGADPIASHGSDAAAEGISARAWGEIGALLVEPRWGRRGHGGRLLAAVADRLRAGGGLYGLAWVPEADEASRRFYARAGWETDGAVRAFDTGAGTIREIRLTGSLDLKLS